MRKILSLLICISASLISPITCFAESVSSSPPVTSTMFGHVILDDRMDLLTDIEEEYIHKNITDAVEKKNISVGVITAEKTDNEIAEYYYNLNAENETDYAFIVFNKNEYEFYFYGSAVEEFSNDEDTFWMTENYIENEAYFAAALQFPLDIYYHTYVSKTVETTTTVVTEEAADDETIVIETAEGIHTVELENGHIALLHDLDDSLSTDDEAVILTDLMDAVREKSFSIGIVITDDIGSDKSDYGVMDFADVYYEEYCGRNTDGVLLLINNDNKYDWLSTSGNCIDMFYGRDDAIFDALYDYLVDENYSYACQRFVQEVEYYSEQDYEYYDDYDYYFDSEEIEGFFGLFVFASFVAIIAISIYAGVINSGYKMKRNVTAANYKLNNSLSFSENTDTYIRTYTTRRTVSSSSSGGRSGGSRSSGRSHRSSGGGRHGGGGRRR